MFTFIVNKFCIFLLHNSQKCITFALEIENDKQVTITNKLTLL